jgi:hypothetical protein
MLHNVLTQDMLLGAWIMPKHVLWHFHLMFLALDKTAGWPKGLAPSFSKFPIVETFSFQEKLKIFSNKH